MANVLGYELCLHRCGGLKTRVPLLLAAVWVAVSFSSGCCTAEQESAPRLKAAIVDQLSSTYPNEHFIDETTQAL